MPKKAERSFSVVAVIDMLINDLHNPVDLTVPIRPTRMATVTKGSAALLNLSSIFRGRC